MKKRIIILFTLVITSLMANAQKEYRLAKSTGNLKLNLNGVIVEGYDGKEIIFFSSNTPKVEIDERAKGLVAIASSGYIDNTGIGVSVTENGQDINVNNVFSNNSEVLSIKVPKEMKVSFKNTNNLYYEDVLIKNIKGEIEVSTHYNKIKLENNAGPMNINSINGSVDASFTGEVNGPISIISIYDYVDVKLQPNIKAAIELSTNYGKLYAAKEFAIEIDKTQEEKSTNQITSPNLSGTLTINKAAGAQINGITGQNASFGYAYGAGEKIKGKLNGGGINLIFKSINKNVYLRHQ